MKVLVLSGRFGMGHEMAANAICEQFRKIDEQAEIEKKDLLEELYPHISKFIFGGFRMMVEHCYGIYNFIYKMSGRMKVEMRPRGKTLYKRLKKIMDGEQPDVIVCTHPMCVKAIASYKEKTGLKTPLVTCITDISMHPEWTASQTDIYLAPTQEIKRHLMKEGGQGGRYSCDRNSGSPAVPGCRLPSETGKKQNTQGAHYGRRTWADAGSERIA